jgi:RNA polymerase sigma-70 factor (ECF subfamily)
VRLHRGRSLLRRVLLERVGMSTKEAFPLMGHRCDRVVKHVFEYLSAAPPAPSHHDDPELNLQVQ